MQANKLTYLIGLFVVLTLLGVGVISRYALLCVVLDGLAAAVVVVPGVLVGLTLVPLFRPSPMPLRWHLLLGAALGLGATSLLVLLLGLTGILQRTVWIGFLLAFAAGGGIRLRTLLIGQHQDRRAPPPTYQPRSTAFRYFWLLVCPFLILALLAAANAPGLIWQEEGFGYDVLEYHLQMPKEYFEAGRIQYAPHNVYANFPANVEMLYLLAMIVQDDVRDIGVTANMVHLMLAALAVFAAWVAGREWSPTAGMVCAVATASAGWLTYLCGLAYVENGMLFFGMVATAVLMRLVRSPARPNKLDRATHTGMHPRARGGIGYLRWVALAGVVAGFACGCKYTALPMIAAPLGLATLLLPGRSARRKTSGGFIFVAAALLTLAPWLIKNQVMTGNPVFPLRNRVFEASPPGWGEEQTERWDRGHGVSPDQQAIAARFGVLWDHLLWDKYHRFGPLVLLLAVGGFVGRRRDRVDLMLLTIVIVQLGVWLFATHLFARFAVPLLIPLTLLCGRALAGEPNARRRRIVVVVLVAGCAWNFASAARLHGQESPGGAPGSLIYEGQLEEYKYFEVVNGELPQDAKILLVGDARAFYFQRQVDYFVVFNRNPFVEAVQAARTERDLLDWLHRQGYTHVLVNWSEIARLGRTYGFSPGVTPALFERLSGAGLSRIRLFPHPATGGRYVELYKVPE